MEKLDYDIMKNEEKEEMEREIYQDNLLDLMDNLEGDIMMAFEDGITLEDVKKAFDEVVRDIYKKEYTYKDLEDKSFEEQLKVMGA